MKILTLIWFLFMTILSHMPGTRSAAESQTLARWTGVQERSLRKAAHIFCFFVLSVLVVLAFPGNDLWLRAVALACWAVVDEATKPLIPGRHFSWKDVLLNLCGAAMGFLVGALIRFAGGAK